MNATVLDDRRRLVMPQELPPKSAVTVQQLDADTWLVRRSKPVKNFVLLTVEKITKLPDDPAWEANELDAAKSLCRKLDPPKF